MSIYTCIAENFLRERTFMTFVVRATCKRFLHKFLHARACHTYPAPIRLFYHNDHSLRKFSPSKIYPFYVYSIHIFLKNCVGHIRMNPLNTTQWAMFWTGKITYCLFKYVMPYFYAPFWHLVSA